MRVVKLLHGAYIFKCPGCGDDHQVKGWQFNGDLDSPTFDPSILVVNGKTVCHSQVTKGNILFYKDSTHLNKGRLLPLEDMSEVPMRWRHRAELTNGKGSV